MLQAWAFVLRHGAATVFHVTPKRYNVSPVTTSLDASLVTWILINLASFQDSPSQLFNTSPCRSFISITTVPRQAGPRNQSPRDGPKGFRGPRSRPRTLMYQSPRAAGSAGDLSPARTEELSRTMLPPAVRRASGKDSLGRDRRTAPSRRHAESFRRARAS